MVHLPDISLLTGVFRVRFVDQMHQEEPAKGRLIEHLLEGSIWVAIAEYLITKYDPLKHDKMYSTDVLSSPNILLRVDGVINKQIMPLSEHAE